MGLISFLRTPAVALGSSSKRTLSFALMNYQELSLGGQRKLNETALKNSDDDFRAHLTTLEHILLNIGVGRGGGGATYPLPAPSPQLNHPIFPSISM